MVVMEEDGILADTQVIHAIVGIEDVDPITGRGDPNGFW